MKYIISEEELRKLILRYMASKTILAQTFVKNFLKPKQPIELVAEGIVMTNSAHLPFIGIIEDNHVKDKFLPLYKPTELRVGNNIKIYIQKVKEDK